MVRIMIELLLVIAALYLLGTWGLRLQVRARLLGNPWLDWGGYACSMLAGTVGSLYGTVLLMNKVAAAATADEIAVFSTLLSILCGELLHARSSRRSWQILSPLRSKEVGETEQ